MYFDISRISLHISMIDILKACRSRSDRNNPDAKESALDKGIEVLAYPTMLGATSPQLNASVLGDNEYHMDAMATQPPNLLDVNGILHYDHTPPDLKKLESTAGLCLNHFLVMFATMSGNLFIDVHIDIIILHFVNYVKSKNYRDTT